MISQFPSYSGRRHWLYSLIRVVICIIILAATFFLGICVAASKAIADNKLLKSYLSTPNPAVCAICGAENPSDVPCIVNLATGNVHELFDVNREDDSTDDTNTSDAVLTAGQRHSGEIYNRMAPMEPSLFCRNCRALILDASAKGYAFLDIRDLQNIKVYAVTPGQTYSVSGYQITVGYEETKDRLVITTTPYQ